jgi:hypothetical protein
MCPSLFVLLALRTSLVKVGGGRNKEMVSESFKKVAYTVRVRPSEQHSLDSDSTVKMVQCRKW